MVSIIHQSIIVGRNNSCFLKFRKPTKRRQCWFWGLVIIWSLLAVVIILPRITSTSTTSQPPHEELLFGLAQVGATKEQENEIAAGANHNDNTIVDSISSSTTTNLEVIKLPIQRTDHTLPQWMMEYFEWHHQQKSKLTADNWDSSDANNKFLIMRCLNVDKICGGTSDRLQSLPYQLLLAHLSKRILLILWERPFPLEEFLLPPQGDGGGDGGLDWRVPSYMTEKLVTQQYNTAPITYAPNAQKVLLSKSKQNQVVVWTRDQTHNHGSAVYDQYHEQLEKENNDNNHDHNSRFAIVFHDVWRMVFTPAPAVGQKTNHWMNLLGLIPGQYASTHVRALYGVHNRSLHEIEEWTINAIHCTTQLWPKKGPFFFASDSTEAQKVALQYGKKVGLNIVSRFHDDDVTIPLHMDEYLTNTTTRANRKPKDYYDGIVDLYLLGNARAVSYNVGGYGKLGLIMGFNATAGIQHQKGGVPWAPGKVTGIKLHKCNLAVPLRDRRRKEQQFPPPPASSSSSSFFAPPMDHPI